MAELRAVALRPEAHVPHPVLHAPDRPWPETNCYLDLWIELLHAAGRDPVPLLGVAAGLSWEGDHFTFLKPCAADLFALTGTVLQELALWDSTEAQVATQLARGAVPLLEVDAFFLPDTAGAAYREQHTKTTIAVSAMDPEAGWLEYFHNAGLFRLSGEDYAGVLGRPPHQPALFPYAELVRLRAGAPPAAPEALRAQARGVLARCAASRAEDDPLGRFAEDLPGMMARTEGDPRRIHALCFNTARQFGGGVGLLADHLAWLGEDGSEATRLAELAKTLQFQISRAARRRRDDPAIRATLGAMSAAWSRLMRR
jgi:hypothetical protein